MRPRGFGLPELMIATALGAALLTAALSGFEAARSRQREVEQLARLNERAAHVFTVLEPELQMAGYGGLQALPGVDSAMLPAASRACGSFAAGPLTASALRVLTSPRWPLACPPRAGGAVPGADVLIITRASGRSSVPEAGRLQLLSGALPEGPRLLRDGRLPEGLALAPGRLELHDLVHEVFYVARRSDGSADLPALRVIELTEVDGVPVLRDSEVLDGVEDLRAEEGWLESDEGGGPLRFTRPGLRPSDRPLLAVRVHLRLRGDVPHTGARTQLFVYAGRDLRFVDGWPRLLAQRSFVPRDLATGPAS